MRLPLSLHANGKILLTGEYLVMLGAKALAVPLNVGQDLLISESDNHNLLSWEASDTGGLWFKATFRLPEITEVDSSDQAVADRLKKLLVAAHSLNEKFLTGNKGLRAETQLGFDRNWGLGSSSTLISLVARWAGVDPMELHWLVSKGSGYDIACSLAEYPVFYSLLNNKPLISNANFVPAFTNNMFLVYLGAKQNSDQEVEKFSHHGINDFSKEIGRINEISDQIALETNLDKFMDMLHEHERIMKSVLGHKTVKEILFSDFEGVVKSLGAWGGDFVLAVSKRSVDYVKEYFNSRSFGIVLSYSNIALMPDKKEIVKL